MMIAFGGNYKVCYHKCFSEEFLSCTHSSIFTRTNCIPGVILTNVLEMYLKCILVFIVEMLENIVEFNREDQ